QGASVNKIVRRLMSGASFAVLSLGVPGFARAASAPASPAFTTAGSAVSAGRDLILLDVEEELFFGVNPSLRNPEQVHLPPLIAPNATTAADVGTGALAVSIHTSARRRFDHTSATPNAAFFEGAHHKNVLVNKTEGVIEETVHKAGSTFA